LYDALPSNLVLLHQFEHVDDWATASTYAGLPLCQFLGRYDERVVAFSDAFHDEVAVGDDSVQAIVVTADRQRTDFEIAHQPCRDQQTLA